MSIPEQIIKIKTAASLFDVRGLEFMKDLNGVHTGFKLHFYRRAPDTFWYWLCENGVHVDEIEHDDDDLGTQYMYVFLANGISFTTQVYR